MNIQVNSHFSSYYCFIVYLLLFLRHYLLLLLLLSMIITQGSSKLKHNIHIIYINDHYTGKLKTLLLYY
jgi:hypothetical protein